MTAACHRYTVHQGYVEIIYSGTCAHVHAPPVGLWILTLPMTRPLTLNARSSHWAIAYRAKAQIKNDTTLLARAQRIPQLRRARVELRYCPATRTKRDADNLVGTLKPAVDGLRAAGVLIDDDPAHAELMMPVIETPREDRKPLVYLIITDTGGTVE